MVFKMTLRILGRKSSANVQKVHWICIEAEIEFKAEYIGGSYGGHDTEEFKKLNPNSTIPVLDDNGFILYESNSIIKYISEKYDVLKTNNAQKSAITNQWIDWSSLVFGLPCSILTAHNLVLPVEKRNPIMAKEAQKKIHSIFEILDNQLLKNNFILGEEFSLADIPIGCWLHRCRVLKIDISSFKGINNWALKLDSRKAFEEAVVSAPLPPN